MKIDRIAELKLPKWERENNMPEETKPKPDLDFIFLSFGLIPINNGCAAIAPGAITHVEIERSGRAIIGVHGGSQFELEPEQLAELARTIRQRSDDTAVLQREAMKKQMQTQFEVQQELQREAQGLISKPVLGRRN